MTIRDLPAKALKLGVSWNIIKLSVAVGAVIGMLFMAVLMAGGQATLLLIERLS